MLCRKTGVQIPLLVILIVFEFLLYYLPSSFLMVNSMKSGAVHLVQLHLPTDQKGLHTGGVR